jgi:hypothetical protein
MKHKHAIWRYVLAFLLALLSVVGIFSYTDPATIGLPGILVVIILLYILFYLLIYVTIRVVLRILQYFRSNKNNIKLEEHKVVRRLPIFSALWALAPVFLISLNSLGEIQLRDIALILLFEALATFYALRKT